LAKNIFFEFCIQKVTKFCSKKKKREKIFLYKNKFGNKNNISGKNFGKKKYFGIFVKKKYF
jgi:hypothetical protein